MKLKNYSINYIVEIKCKISLFHHIYVRMIKASPLYNFIGVAFLNLLLQQWMDPSKVPFNRRKDCGFFGISVPTCVTTGKYRLAFANPIVMIQLAVMALLTVGVSMYMFNKSGFPKPAKILYFTFALYTFFVTTKCNYDSNVPDGLPHCYF